MLPLAYHFLRRATIQHFTTTIIFANGRVFNYLFKRGLLLALLENICISFSYEAATMCTAQLLPFFPFLYIWMQVNPSTVPNSAVLMCGATCLERLFVRVALCFLRLCQDKPRAMLSHIWCESSLIERPVYPTNVAPCSHLILQTATCKTGNQTVQESIWSKKERTVSGRSKHVRNMLFFVSE
jgi:hypothetical protein